MYKIIFDKDELFTFLRDGIKEDFGILNETNLITIIIGLLIDLMFLPLELIKAIKIRKET